MKSQSMLSLSAWLLALLVVPLTAAAQDTEQHTAPAVTRYRLTDLGTLSGGNFSQPFAINSSNVIAGSSNLSNNDQHSALWSKGQMTDLGTLGGSNSIAFGINNSESVVGEAESSISDPNREDFCGFGTHLICQPFFWQNDVMTPLPALGGNNGVANWVNRWGTVVGQAESATEDSKCPAPQKLHFLPVMWKNGRAMGLPIQKGDRDGIAFGINNYGRIVGTSGTCAAFNPIFLNSLQPVHALLWEHRKLVDMGSLGGLTGNEALFINNSGQAVGVSDLAGDTTSHGFLWTKATGMQDLGVVCQQVVPVETGTTDGRSVIQTSMRAVPVVLMKPARQFDGALLRVVVSTTVGPFPQRGLDESFGFAIGARGVGTGEALANAELAAELEKVAGAIAGTVIGEHAGDGDAEAGVVIDGSLQESRRRRRFLVRQDLREGDAGVVVDGDMHVLPAGAMDAAAAVAGDAATDSPETSDLLDVEVEEIAGSGMFIAHDGRSRFQIADATEVEAAQDAADRGATESGGLGDAQAGPALAAQTFDQTLLIGGATSRRMQRTRGPIL